MLIVGKMLGVSESCKNKPRLLLWLDMKSQKICIDLKKKADSL